MTVGQRIKAARQKAGLTQKELGERIGVSFQGVAQWENDLRNPKYETLQRIAAALNVSVSYLLGRNERVIIPGRLKIIEYENPESDYYSYEIEAEDPEAFSIGQGILQQAGLLGDEHTPLGHIKMALEKLNQDGQIKAVERVEELTEIPKYQKENPPQDET